MHDISKVTEKQCTGCYACYNKCPKSAIEMAQNEEGFYYPRVDRSKCVSCGLCVTVCPTIKKNCKTSVKQLYRANAKELLTRERGSSGGIFELLSKTVMDKSGVVYGAVYSAEQKQIIHSSTDVVPIERLLKSKYVQSQINLSFVEIRDHLNKGTLVLFSGTPCQVAGLKSFLGKNYENLVTVDFMCHGVPSPGLFSKNVAELEKEHGSDITDVVFRSKVNGWRRSTTTTTYANGDVVHAPNRESMFYMLFLNNYSLRKTCYKCDYYCKHVSDLTLADDWRIPSDIDDDTGMSLIFVNTENGKAWINKISTQINSYELDATNFDYEFYKHAYSVRGRNKFYSDYRCMPYDQLKGKWEQMAFSKRQSMFELIKYYGTRFLRK